MPSGVYKRTKPISKRWQAQLKRLHALPRTQKQIEAARQNGLNNKGKPSSYRATVFGSDIIKHHNDLCHGAKNPDDVNYMTMSEHSSLHAKLRVEDGTNPFLSNNRRESA